MPTAAHFDAIQLALDSLISDGELVRGTKALIEAIKEHQNWNYSQIAKKVGVSIPGLNRWRINNAGTASRVKTLIDLGNYLVGNVEEYNDELRTDLSLNDVIKAVPLRRIEDALNESLKNLFPSCLDSCTVVNIKMLNKAVSLEIHLA